MKVLFKKDAESIVAPNGVYKKGSVYDIPDVDGNGFILNKFAVLAKEEKEVNPLK